jgi:hypothetical protein
MCAIKTLPAKLAPSVGFTEWALQSGLYRVGFTEWALQKRQEILSKLLRKMMF